MITNMLILLLLAVMWCWNLPDDYVCRRLIQPLKGLILYLGLWHGWNMFAPEPLFVNRRLMALIYLADGSTIEWRPEDMGRQSLWRAFLLVRERKLIDNLLSGQMSYLKPAFAEFLARQHRKSGLDVVKVELIQWRRPVPPPERWRELAEFESKIIWTYNVPTSRRAEASERSDNVISPIKAGDRRVTHNAAVSLAH